ncbi:KAP family P-loop NTPase fold protein, partial [Clostridium novyi]|uniref:KAP family P-loop NTPase fold protein n=1 Tax=Clostridium novyi TaxID=1542 RepID=UPI0004D84C0B
MENNLNNFEQDLLNRKPLAENLINIIEKSNDINVIAIDSAWGTGKTTFIKMWENMINTDERYKDKFETLYFNAWENDYIKDPLLAFISEIAKQLNKDDGKLKKGLNHIKEYGKKLIKPLTVTGVRLLTHGILDLEKFKFEEFTKNQINKLMGNISEISLQEIVEDKETRSEFISELKNYIEKNNTNMIFFIDELDRCRPLFAIELLEVIKHLFNITGITFIISVDKEQLSHSISTLYGQNMDSDGYLRRFFDLEYKIPIINKEV